MPDCEHPSPSGCYTCLSDRQLLALTAEYLCTILETGIPSGPPVGTQDVNVVSSVTLTVQGDTGRTWTLDFASDQVDVSGSTVIATGSLGRTWDLDFATDQVDVSGSSVSVSNFPASFGVTQITSPWVTNDPGLPDALGQTTMAGSTSVVIASDQTKVPVAPEKSSTATLSNVAGNAASVTLLSSNASRLGASFFNDSISACYVKLGSTASTSSFTVKMGAGSFHEIGTGVVYTGRIDAIWDTGTGNMRITELTA